jgi:hypothetical protein
MYTHVSKCKNGKTKGEKKNIVLIVARPGIPTVLALLLTGCCISNFYELFPLL